MRAIWSGSIGFGLVNIPVNIFSAVSPGRVDLDMLDRHDRAKIHYMRVNEKTGREVKWEDVVKGFKLDNDEYVVLSDEDLLKVGAEKSSRIEIKEFADADAIDIVYYETPYYLGPAKHGEQAYALLREALLKTNKVGIALFVMRTKETLAILKADKNVIVLVRLRFPEEIRSIKGLELPAKTNIKDAELKMAIRLIEENSGKFDITAYKNTYHEQLMKLIQAKAKGLKITAPKLKVVQTKSKDLMSKLKASLKKSKAA